MGPANSTQTNTRTVARCNGVNYNINSAGASDVTACLSEQLQIIKDIRLNLVLEQVCNRFASLLSDPNDCNSRNELANALRSLVSRIDRYLTLSTVIRHADMRLHSKLLSIQVDSQVIANNFDDKKDQKLTPDGVLQFKTLTGEFLTDYRTFCVDLFSSIEGDNYLESNASGWFEKFKDRMQSFKEFIVDNWWWIPLAITGSVVAGALTGGIAAGPVAAVIAGAAGGVATSASILKAESSIYARRKQLGLQSQSKYKDINFD